MTKPRFLAFPVLAIALALTVAGCGGQPFPQASSPSTAPRTTPAKRATPQARLLAAVQTTNAAKTARFAVDMSLSGLGKESGAHLGLMTVTASGAMDLTRQRFTMKVQSTDPTVMSMDMRVIGSTMYVNEGAGWTSESVTAAGTFTPVPTNYLDYLKGLAGTVRVAGHEKVRGEDTTSYDASISFSQVVTQARSLTERAMVKALFDQMGVTKIPVTVWLDELGRMRKMTMTLDLKALGQGTNAPADFAPKMAITLEMYDFGAPVSVEVPSGAVKKAGSSGSSAASTTAHNIQSDLRNALTAEKVVYTDDQAYSDDLAGLREIESSLDWGGRLTVVVGDSSTMPDGIVCLSETSNGLTYAIGDIGSGRGAGTYFGTTPCPKSVSDTSFAAFDSSW